jgi:aminoglycoside phosphotransferase
MKTTVVPILIGKSAATVMRVLREDGLRWIEKRGAPEDLDSEARILEWCAGRLPVPAIIERSPGSLKMSELSGHDLTEVPVEEAVDAIAEGIRLFHAVPVENCPFVASWERRLAEGAVRAQAGLIDESDFDVDNRGRSTDDILSELKSFRPLPNVARFTHGDACLPNFLASEGRLSGIVDVGRAGVTHPAQDWALAFRSLRDNWGEEAEERLWTHVPPNCADKELLRRFRLLDELF